MWALALALAVGLSGCAHREIYSDCFAESNNDIQITAFFTQENNLLEIGETLTILIENSSINTVYFPSDGYVLLFIRSDSKDDWNKVDDLVNRKLSPERLLTPIGTIDSRGATTIWPDIPSDLGSGELLICLQGSYYEDGYPTENQLFASGKTLFHR